MPGAFKLDHLQPFKPILFWKIFNFFPFILGSPFLLPQRANFGSWENFPSPNMDDTEGFQCLGHSNWTIYGPLSPFYSDIFPTFSLSSCGANSYYSRGLIMGKGIHPTSKLDETKGFQWLGHSNWTICSLLSQFCIGNFPIEIFLSTKFLINTM